ncbi:hypothetical protein T484DRAFT_3643077 [Baffinella frigidus]|nr:hypothetical protein T484DRAFT_3643077 [Cryptophyta sp. CCMP2293]
MCGAVVDQMSRDTPGVQVEDETTEESRSVVFPRLLADVIRGRLSAFAGAGALNQALDLCTQMLRGSSGWPCTLTPTPYTLHPTSYTLHPTPYILHPTPYTLHPKPYILHPTPYTLHPTSYTLHPTSYTIHPTPYTLHPTSYTLHLTPCRCSVARQFRPTPLSGETYFPFI